MKQVKIVVFFLLFSSFSNYNWGQGTKNIFEIGFNATRFSNVELYTLYGPHEGYYKHPTGSGIEAIYYRCLTPNTRVGAGLSWQNGRVASYLSGLRRFKFDEVAVPLVFQTGFTFCRKYRFFFTTGAVVGDVIHIRAESPDKNESWHVYNDFDFIEKNSGDTFFIDYYLDAGFSRIVFKQNEISIVPFIKNRINTTWLNLHEKKFMYGIKLTYSIKF